MPYLSSGELLRAQVAAGTPLGQQVADDLAAGDLVPDEVMLEALREPLHAAMTSGGYVLDGFPRNLAQALELETFAARIGGAPEIAVWFDVEDASCSSGPAVARSPKAGLTMSTRSPGTGSTCTTPPPHRWSITTAGRNS